MQDIHSLSGGGTPAAARLFAAVAAAGDRHLGRHYHHHHPSNQALKCPRCDSLNTKFCYYNNYNLSQPRHFCKSCRRYWTKGGVLRNVPVGGGCRKSRRPSSSSKSSSSKPPPSPSPSAEKPKPLEDSAMNSAANNNNNDNHLHSSSDSSTLTATAPPETPTLLHECGSTCLEKTTKVPATETYGSVYITLDRPIGSGVGRDDVSTSMLTELGDFTGFMSSTAEITPFGYGEVLTQQQTHQQEMVVVEGFGPLDWQVSGDGNNGVDRGEVLFDLTGAVDHAYWSQQNQWTAADVDVDHHHQQQEDNLPRWRGGGVVRTGWFWEDGRFGPFFPPASCQCRRRYDPGHRP